MSGEHTRELVPWFYPPQKLFYWPLLFTDKGIATLLVSFSMSVYVCVISTLLITAASHRSNCFANQDVRQFLSACISF